ncbi:MAG: hypothetical protein WDW36_001732 [Sanguina aurantia]
MEDTRGRWERAYLEAVDFDTWGQVEEALEGYQRLQVAASAEHVENVLQLGVHRREGIGKFAAVLKHRMQELQSNQDRGVGLVGMKKLKAYMKDIITTDGCLPGSQDEATRDDSRPQPCLVMAPSAPSPLPGIEAEQLGATGPVTSGGGSDNEEDELDQQEPSPASQQAAGDGTLRGPNPSHGKGESALTIFIEKWGFKDVGVFTDPRVVISVRDADGNVLEALQETPKGKGTNSSYVFFENTVHIQTCLRKLPEDSAIFFEFKHYKQKEKKWSCKAYCFLELDEIRAGPVTLEVYKKPAIFARNRKPSLLSIKPLYLHLDMTIAATR